MRIASARGEFVFGGVQRRPPRAGGWPHACLVVAVAAVFGLVFNLPALAPMWRGQVPLGVAAAHVAGIVALTLVWVLALSASRVVSFLAIPAVAVLGVAYAYYAQTVGIEVNEHLFAGIFQTQPGEVKEFFNATTVALLVLTVAAGFGAAAAVHHRRPSRRTLRWAIAVVALLSYWAIAAKASPHFARNELVFPFNVHRALAKYLGIRAKVRDKLQHKTDVAKAYPHSLRADASDDLVVVVVLGEAARGDHLQLNGYPRETTPELARLAPNLVSFSDVWSCGGVTQRSVPCMLTRATPKTLDVSNTETSFISVLRAVGFDTSWVSCDGQAYEYTVPINSIAFEAEHVYFTEEIRAAYQEAHEEPPCWSCDGFQLAQVKRSVRSTEGKGRAFVLMQTHGSHLEYLARYPREYSRFTPECRESFENVRTCSVDSVVNAYDNTVAYTDHVLREVIGTLEKRNALLFYVADHGQHLGEQGYFFHGYLVPDHSWAPLRRVPWVVWASDRFMQVHPDQFANLRANKDRAISHDHLFHTVLDCAGVDSSAIDKGLSLCAAQTRAREEPPPRAERETIETGTAP